MATTSDIDQCWAGFEAVVAERSRRVSALEDALEELHAAKDLADRGVSLASKCLEDKVRMFAYFEGIVSEALTTLFGTPHKFILEQSIDEKTLALKGIKPLLKEGDGEPYDPVEAGGSAAQSVITFALRATPLVLTRKTGRLLIMDEPFVHVSPDLTPGINEFLRTLVADTSLQIIIGTHGSYACDVHYHVKKVDGVSKVSKLAT